MNRNTEITEHHEEIIKELTSRMTEKEILYLFSCLNATESFRESSPTIGIKMLKFNSELDSWREVEQKWDGTIDAFLSMYEPSSRKEYLLNEFLQLINKLITEASNSIKLTKTGSSSVNSIF